MIFDESNNSITKKSSNKQKIDNEISFYKNIPNAIKRPIKPKSGGMYAGIFYSKRLREFYQIYVFLNTISSKESSDLATTQATVASPVTFTDVRIMSNILSTAKIIPIASRGRPNC